MCSYIYIYAVFFLCVGEQVRLCEAENMVRMKVWNFLNLPVIWRVDRLFSYLKNALSVKNQADYKTSLTLSMDFTEDGMLVLKTIIFVT